MGGRLAHRAEVAGRSGQAPAGVEARDAVDDEAGGKRVFGRRDGLGQLAAAATAGERLRLAIAKHAEKVPRDRGTFVVDAATNEDVEIGRGAVADDMDRLLWILSLADGLF